MFHKICCAYDGSPGAERALAAALRLTADQQAAPLHLVTVEENLPRYAATVGEMDEAREEEGAYARQLLAPAQAQAQAQGVAVATAIRSGHPAQALLQYLEEGGFDLLVIGQSGHSAVWGRFLGSTVEKVVRNAPCSVLIVRKTDQAPPPSGPPPGGIAPG